MKAQSSLAVRRIVCKLIPGTLLLLLCGYAFAQKMPESGQGPSVAPSFILGNENDYAGIDRCLDVILVQGQKQADIEGMQVWRQRRAA